MGYRRKWLRLYPVVPLCGVCYSDYDEVLKHIFEGNPAIPAVVLQAFLSSGYQVNVAASELEQWINVARLHCADHLLAYNCRRRRRCCCGLSFACSLSVCFGLFHMSV